MCAGGWSQLRCLGCAALAWFNEQPLRVCCPHSVGRDAGASRIELNRPGGLLASLVWVTVGGGLGLQQRFALGVRFAHTVLFSRGPPPPRGGSSVSATLRHCPVSPMTLRVIHDSPSQGNHPARSGVVFPAVPQDRSRSDLRGYALPCGVFPLYPVVPNSEQC